MKIAVAHKLELYDGHDELPGDALILPIKAADAVLGESIDSFLARAGWRFDLPTICLINGECYARAEWSERHLGLNDNVEFVSRPTTGGSSSGQSGGKNIMAIVGLLALTVLAPYAMGAIGLTGIAASVGSSLLIAGGSLLLSHLLQPKTTGKSDANPELYSFAFGANQARPLQMIPVGYGRRIDTPDLGSPSYSEFSGDSMTEYGLYCLGAGKYSLEELRIDDTTIWTAAGGYDASFPGISHQVVQPGEQVSLFPINVVSATEVSGVELSTTNTPGYTVNAAGTLATAILLDFVWPSGAYQTYKDRTLATPTQIVIEGRLINAAGAPLSDWFPAFSKVYSFSKQTQVRITEQFGVAPGRYEFRARRGNPSITGQTLFDGKVSGTDTVQWTALRAHIDGPNTFPDVTMLAVRAEANASLNGVTNGKLRTITTRILPVWNGNAFVEQPTRSIAWAALDAWRNTRYSAGMSVDQVDFQSFVEYDALWTNLNHTFDHRFSQPDTLDNILETILKAGRAMPSFIGDRISITREEPRTIPQMMFNDFNIVAGSLSIDYVLADSQFADGVSGQYLDQDSWRLADVTSAPNGALLEKPAQIELTGVVFRQQAAELVRFHAAEHQYRRITVTWQTGLEGKMLHKGSLVEITSDQPETWGQSRELVAVDQAHGRIQLSPAPEWDPDELHHYVQVQRKDGQPWGPIKCTMFGTDPSILVLDPADLASETTRQGISLWDAVDRTALQELPIANFSPGQPRSFPVLIIEGTPDQDGEHITLKGVQDAPAVYDIDGVTGVPPVPPIPDLVTAKIPTIRAIGMQVFQRAVQLILSAGWEPAQGALTYEADVSYDNDTWTPAYRGDRTTFEAAVSGAETIYVRVRGRTADGTPGGYSVQFTHPPALEASQQYVTFKLTPQDFEQQIARVFDSLPLLFATADFATETHVLADAANELGRANVTQIAAARVDLDRAYAIFGTTVTAQYNANGATLSDVLEGLADADTANAQATQTVQANVGSLSATVTTQASAIAAFNGQVVGSYIVKVDVNGYFGGFQIVTATGAAGAVTSEFRIATDRFLIGPAGGGTAQAAFVVALVGGVAKVAIRGDLYADGTIGAGAIQATSLSAISANLGSINAGNIIITGAAGSLQFYE